MNFQNQIQEFVLSSVLSALVSNISVKVCGTGWAKKNGTQTTINNFFVIWYFTLQFTQITLQQVQFAYLKGFFVHNKIKKVIANLKKKSFSTLSRQNDNFLSPTFCLSLYCKQRDQ